MIAIPIILTNNASDAFLLVKIELIEYMSFYLTNLFVDVLLEFWCENKRARE
jgi:hypothetical protein